MTDPGPRSSPDRSLIALVVLVVGVALWGFLAPEERVLGGGIRWVYVHVSATWAGSLGLLAAGALGLAQIAQPKPRLGRGMDAVGAAGLTLFAVGFGLSLVAAKANWGHVLWSEPRVALSLRLLGAGSLAWLASSRFVDGRVKGMPWVMLATLAAFELGTARRVIHPEGPIHDATSEAIRWTFYGMFVAQVAIGALLASRWSRQPGGTRNAQPRS